MYLSFSLFLKGLEVKENARSYISHNATQQFLSLDHLTSGLFFADYVKLPPEPQGSLLIAVCAETIQ